MAKDSLEELSSSERGRGRVITGHSPVQKGFSVSDSTGKLDEMRTENCF